jgi:hypothetical protein
MPVTVKWSWFPIHLKKYKNAFFGMGTAEKIKNPLQSFFRQDLTMHVN